jgi:hypothetical protein
MAAISETNSASVCWLRAEEAADKAQGQMTIDKQIKPKQAILDFGIWISDG